VDAHQGPGQARRLGGLELFLPLGVQLLGQVVALLVGERVVQVVLGERLLVALLEERPDPAKGLVGVRMERIGCGGLGLVTR